MNPDSVLDYSKYGHWNTTLFGQQKWKNMTCAPGDSYLDMHVLKLLKVLLVQYTPQDMEKEKLLVSTWESRLDAEDET